MTHSIIPETVDITHDTGLGNIKYNMSPSLIERMETNIDFLCINENIKLASHKSGCKDFKEISLSAFYCIYRINASSFSNIAKTTGKSET